MASPVLIQVAPQRAEEEEIQLVEDLDELVESSKCSCNAGDDNPY
jgi:hypothetical protein